MSSLHFRPALVSPWKKKSNNNQFLSAVLNRTSPPSMAALPNSNHKPIFISHLLSFALSITLTSPFPSLAIPSFNSLSSPLSPTTPFSQSKDLPIGLENGKIRPCPSINPSCVSTNPKSSSFAFPLSIPESFTGNPIQKLQEVILETQRNAKIQMVEDTPYEILMQEHAGQYMEAEVDGNFGRDVIEFLVRGDVAAYRIMAAKVTYVYPFTTALGDSKGQEERMKKIIEELDWYSPTFESMVD
ncbi:thylakoid lumenal 17.9 kDa protein, chloroplastic isoform X1 [Cucurbita pepo subsp. pepo]|uniref:thylakoid lumenal 17.9 kDa protein, chloroplastic isoform X1 n=1 Tax=Cucurbita pepo subsp. pepo TaxID=3664 RepID=UPI000C9D672E|nr:thylakoid lumenal 17.9 kDa protein, chloroplastic isoform X1 [Cucurbita pepo subsp. pepo]